MTMPAFNTAPVSTTSFEIAPDALTTVLGHEIYEAIDALRLAAIEIDDHETAAKCAGALGCELYDSETGAIIPIGSAPSLYSRYGFSRERFAGLGEELERIANYVYLISLSQDEGAEGHICVAGRRVYAA